jgi:hypothetical protein
MHLSLLISRLLFLYLLASALSGNMPLVLLLKYCPRGHRFLPASSSKENAAVA